MNAHLNFSQEISATISGVVRRDPVVDKTMNELKEVIPQTSRAP